MTAWVLPGISIILAVLALLVILTQSVSISVIKRKSILLDFNFTFLAFSLDIGDSDKTKNKTKKHSNPPFTVIMRVLTFCLSGSHLELRKFNYPRVDLYYKNPFINGVIDGSISAILAYLISSASSYEIADSADEVDADIYVILHTTLIHLIFTALLYLNETYKIRRKARARI